MKPFFQATLPFPPSVNDYWGKKVALNPFTKKRYVQVYLTNNAKMFRSIVIAHVADLGRIRTHTGAIKADVTLHPADRKKRDVDNYCKGLFDALTHARVIKDDSQIKEMTVRFGENVKGGACVIKLYELDNI